MKRCAGYLPLILTFFILNISASSQNLPETDQKIRRLVERREYAAAADELQKLRRTDRKLYEINNYDYLLGRLQEKTGAFAGAMAQYQSVVNRNSVLKEYAAWHLAQLARSSGNLLLERTLLQEIQTFAPSSLLGAAIAKRLPRSFYEGKNYSAAIKLLESGASAANADPLKTSAAPPTPNAAAKIAERENLTLLAQSYQRANDPTKAAEVFTRLINNLPNPAQPDDYALTAARALDALAVGAENSGRVAPALGDYDHLKRALIYSFNRDFTDARLHYLAIIENYPGSGNVPDAMYQVGRTYAQSGEYTEAINWFERVQEQFPDHPVAKDALSQAASAYARVGKFREAVTRYQKFIEKYPNADGIERPYLNIIDVSRDAGDAGDALKWAQKTQEVFRGKLPEALALFAQARIHITQNDWQNALADLEKLQTFADLGGTRVPGGTNAAEIAFMKAAVLEQLQRQPEAVEIYLSIPDGRGEYYGWRATERLRAIAADAKFKVLIAQKISELVKNLDAPPADSKRRSAQAVLRLTDLPDVRSKMLEAVKNSYAELPDYQKIPSFKLIEYGRKEVLREARPAAAISHRVLADELLFLGLYDEGTPELEAALAQPAAAAESQNQKSQIAYTLAVYYKRGNAAHRAVGFAEPLWRAVPADYQIELMPRDQAELLYPAPYADALLRYAPERNIDPRFALSIMRQESRYRADVKSYAAARGLMQFISTTADRIAGELGRDNFVQDDLYDPPTAILFGSQYLADLFKQFPGQPQAVAAGYNGGEDNVKRWLARAKSDAPDRYVPEIVFSQSKDYAYKVLANYRVYQVLYDENLKAR